ncbi:MAG: hypothetical protein EHM33_29765 [Chloroflexi bacterium]|nr:MAG: hypothetical protein EHM33_29765 [Chloroflexota bacterium]
MNADQINTGRGYWLAWFLASVIGFGMGAVLGVFFAYRFFPPDTFDTAHGITLGIVMGAIGGYVQWVALRERVAGAGLWGLASAVGFGSAMGALLAANPAQNPAMAGLLVGIVFGLVSGILQWLILRRKVPRAGWWLLANLLGSLVGAIGLSTAVAISETGNWGLAIIVFGMGFGAGNGSITGAALVWLLRQSPSGDVEGLATAH